MKELLTLDNLKDIRCIGVFGNMGSGKSALSFKILETFGDVGKKIYLLNHPNPDLIEELGYENVKEMSDVLKLEDSIIYWDEPQFSVAGLPEYKKDIVIAKFCSLLRQRGNTLIISTSDTRVFSPRVESYIDLWLIKNCDFEMVKQRSKIKKIIQKNTLIAEFPSISLEKNEYLSDSDTLKKLNGEHTFELPNCWSEDLSCAYRSKKMSINTTKLQGNSPDSKDITIDVNSYGKEEVKKEIQE